MRKLADPFTKPKMQDILMKYLAVADLFSDFKISPAGYSAATAVPYLLTISVSMLGGTI